MQSEWRNTRNTYSNIKKTAFDDTVHDSSQNKILTIFKI